MRNRVATITIFPFLFAELFVSMTIANEPIRFFEPVVPPRPVQVVALGGLPFSAPRNSLRSMEMCVEDFYEWIALDVRLTRDRKHIVFHKERVDENSNGMGAVSDLTLDELKRLDIGTWFNPRFKNARIQSLAEVLAWGKGKINFQFNCVNIDPTLFAKEVLDAGMENQIVAYVATGEPTVLSKIDRVAEGKVRLMARWSPDMIEPKSFVRTHSLSIVYIHIRDLTVENCAAFKKLGVKVLADTAGPKWDLPKNWQKAADAGVDQILTEEPLRVLMTLFRQKHPVLPVKVAFHRGANRYAPENTIRSIVIAEQLQADYVEIDIRTTKDGEHFLLHDRSLDRTTDRKGLISDYLSRDLKDAPANRSFSDYGSLERAYSLPTLDEVLESFQHSPFAFYLDCKDITPEDVAKVLQKRDLFERSAVYQSVEYLTKLKKIEPRARGMAAFSKQEEFDKIVELKPYAVDAKWSLLSKEMIQKCHDAGIKVFSDALGFHETIKEYNQAIDWGIDVIQTDYPAKMLRAMEIRLAKPK